MRRQDISAHDINYVEYASSCLTRENISATSVTSVWMNDKKKLVRIMAGVQFIFIHKNCLNIGHYVTNIGKSWCADVVPQTLCDVKG